MTSIKGEKQQINKKTLRFDIAKRNKSIYLHCSGPLLENGLDRPENRYGRCCFGKLLVFQHFHIYRRGGRSQS